MIEENLVVIVKNKRSQIVVAVYKYKEVFFLIKDSKTGKSFQLILAK
jgi:hypothetical protein